MKRIYWLAVLVVLFSACVPNKRIVYLQNDPEPKRGKFNNTDSLSRDYTTRIAEYILKPRDIITVRIASITPGEFDFVKKYEEQLGLIRKLGQYDQGGITQGGGQAGGNMGGGQGGDGISALMLDQQFTGFVLDEAGYLELPFIGKQKLAGLTVPQTETLIREKLTGYFETPVIRVQLLSFHFTIFGEVNKEGRFTSYNPTTSIMDAVSLAGNLSDFADRSAVKVIRYQGDRAHVFYVNMLQEDLLSQPGFFLQPNDMIIVPPLKARFLKKYGLQSYSAALTLITSTITMIVLISTLRK